MKKLPTYAVLLTSSILVGCDKYDIKVPQDLQPVEFYYKNEEKALKVQQECKRINDEIEQTYRSISESEQQAFDKYLSQFDASKFKNNCKNADEALRNIEYDKKEAEKIAKEQAEKEAKEARKNEIIKYMKDTYASYEQLSWQDGLSKVLSEIATSKSSNDSSNSAGNYFMYRNEDMSSIDEKIIKNLGSYDIGQYIDYGDKYGNTLKEADKNDITLIYSANQLWQKGLAELKAKNYAELAVDESYCKKDKRKYSACNVWHQAVSEKRAEVVKNYTVNYDSLKTDYNQCVAQLEDYLKSVNVGKNDKDVPYDILKGIRETEKNIYAKYPCSETEEALKKLNLNFDHYEKLD